MTRTTPHGRRVLAAACGLALAFASVQAADARLGDLDPSFDGDGVALPDVGVAPAATAQFEAVTTRPAGAPIAAGWLQSGAGEEAVVAQLTPSGAPDATFGAGGITRISPNTGFYTRLHGIALDGDGLVYGAGDRRSTTAPAGQVNPTVFRYSPSGTLQLAVQFGVNLGEAHAVVPLPDGRMLVAGWEDLDGTRDRFLLARLLPTGAADQTFGGGDGIAEGDFGPGVDARALTMAIAPSGEIVLAGWAFISGVTVPALARFDANAAAAPQLLTPAITNPSGQTGGLLNDVQIDGAGRITAAGFSGSGYALVLRLLGNGSLDPGFGAGGARYGAIDESAELGGLALDGDRAVVAGAAGPGRGPQQLLLGSLDGAGTPEARLGGIPAGWRTFAIGTRSEALDVALGPAGAVYTAGNVGTPTRPFVARHLGNAAPVAALASAGSATTGAPVTFDAGASSDPEGEALAFAFDLDGNGSYEFDGGGNPFAVRSFPAPGTYTVGVRVTDPRGASGTAARTLTVTAAQVPPPQPLLGKQGVARPVRGIVRVRLPGTKKFVRLTELTAIPNGTEIDARKGRVLITVLHDASGRLDAARFYAGRFIFNQGKGATPITTLKLSGGSFASCTARARRSVLAVAASARGGKKKKPVRKLWGDGRGRFRTRGKYGAATVRGTKWLTQDRCDGTRIKVERGKVDAADLVRPKRKPKRLTAGDAILIRKAG